MSKDQEKAQLGAMTLKCFCESWGTDIHSRILLEVLFEGLLHEETLFVFGKPQQEGNQIDNSPAIGIDNNGQIDGNKPTKPSPNLGKKDPADYL